MSKETEVKKLQQEAARLDKSYGHRTGGLGSDKYQLNVIPTGIISLDYALGIGGWPLGHPVEIFGPPDIGKSSIIGFNALKEAQKQGKLCGIVALEPSFDKEWAVKNGVDPDMVAIARPNKGEDAFAILHDWVNGDVIDFILFDSIGALLKGSETEEKGKPMQGGQSGLITWGVKRILAPTWKNNKSVMFLNQVRAEMNSHIAGLVESPGGNALKHSSAIRVQLKPGRDQYKQKVAGEDVTVGRSIIAVIKRNKLSEGSGQRAVFDYYQKETDDHTIGIDLAADVLNTGMKVGVIERAGGWYKHDTFPEGKLQGKDAVAEAIHDDPKMLETIRNEVMAKIRHAE